ncbi:hypothetical protein DH09_04770 [Bacillaceae bacterium JMAK1]|nr:hypothetical protein DH09_04770 [Bacillaceae bacterium JMAK1]
MNVTWHQLPHALPVKTRATATNESNRSPEGNSFQTALQDAQKTNPITISKHAKTRIEERGITISDQDWLRVSEKVKEAHTKGINQPLVITDNAALIVSGKNHTVVTAMAQSEMNDRIISNIDGTIIVKPSLDL